MPSPDPYRILKQHVLTDHLLGVEAVPSPPINLNAPSSKPTASNRGPAPRPSQPSSTQRPARQTARPSPPSRPAPSPPAPVSLNAEAVRAGLSLEEKQKQLAALCQEFEADAAVQRTRPTGTNLVWADGSPDSAIMFIGEGPGEQEDKQGLPFVGPAGELLNKMIIAMGLDRQQVYIANVVKYRPPGNRTPNPEEVAAQGPYLARQVAIVNPKAIVALGGAAAKFAMQSQTGITRLRGQWSHFAHTNPPIDLMPTFHPAYLLRSYTPDNRKKVWADLQAVLEKINA